jgi:hypothetical protein
MEQPIAGDIMSVTTVEQRNRQKIAAHRQQRRLRLRHVRFIVVNGRTPRSRRSCVMCDQPAGESYLRELGTQLVYCDHDCYAEHCTNAILLLEAQAMAS